MLIPTRTRDRLRRGTSYPIGAESLSAGLADVPQFAKLSVSFRKSLPLQVASVSSSHRGVLGALYRNVEPGISGSRYAIDSGFFDESWELYVAAVERSAKARVGAVLVSEGIQAVRSWMLEPRTEVWRSGEQRIAVGLDLKGESISVDEGRTRYESHQPKPKRW